jgi:hypothetical protein
MDLDGDLWPIAREMVGEPVAGCLSTIAVVVVAENAQVLDAVGRPEGFDAIV